MGLQEQTIVQSVNKAITIANVDGTLNLKNIYLYNIISEYVEYTRNTTTYYNEHQVLKTLQGEIKRNNATEICSFKTVLPNNVLSGTPPTYTPTENNPVATNFTVDTISELTLFGTGDTYPTYQFKLSDFLAAYDDTNDKLFHSVVIDRTVIPGGGNLKYNSSPTTGATYGFSATAPPIEIQYADVEKWSFVTVDDAIYTHPITMKFIDRVQGDDYYTNTIVMTIDRTDQDNQPATLGDSTIVVDNNVVTTISLTMITSGLTPPYNDPEGDLIDAIKITEISTANKGTYKLNGTDIAEGDVITREDIQASLFYHQGAVYNDFWADSFTFQARDEGSQIWVD